ncbi:MAG: tyrosine-type recombinase/integrase [Thiohalocapsa sp.]
MARQARDARLETRDARARLKVQHEPYWRQIHAGLFVGYRKGTTGGVWIARIMEGARYRKKRLGIADDHQDADGDNVLTFAQASRRTMAIADGDIELSEINRGGYSVADACGDYLADYKTRGKDYSGADQNFRKHIERQIGGVVLKKLTADRIRKWRNALAETDSTDPDTIRKRKATANRIFNVLRAALTFAYQNDKLETDRAWRQVKPFAGADVPRVEYQTPTEAKRLLNGCEPDFRALVHGALLTGARYGELTALEVSDLNTEGARAFIRDSKSGKPRFIPLSDEGVGFFTRQVAGKHRGELVFTRADGGPWQRAHQHRRIKAACAAAGIEPAISFHILRHTYGSALAQAGVPLKVIAEALGHADTRMTERHYGHLSDQYIANQVRTNLPSFGFVPDNVAVIGGMRS